MKTGVRLVMKKEMIICDKEINNVEHNKILVLMIVDIN